MTDFNHWRHFNRPPQPRSHNQFINVLRQAYEAGAASQGEDLRDRFAGQAMAGMCANDDGTWMKDHGATWAYITADAMLEARKTTGGGEA
jgi:hypothetical protein